MTPNEIISKARGECRHEREYENHKSNYVLYSYKNGYRYRCSKCKKLYVNWPDNTNYSDPSAWDSELYQWIEERGLVAEFLKHLKYITQTNNMIGTVMEFAFWRIAKSTPAQKAEALSKAIREVEHG
jgi:hypothetical protein